MIKRLLVKKGPDHPVLGILAGTTRNPESVTKKSSRKAWVTEICNKNSQFLMSIDGASFLAHSYLLVVTLVD